MTNKVEFTSTNMIVADIEISKNFYQHLLDQKVVQEDDESVVFASGFTLQNKTDWCDETYTVMSAIITPNHCFELNFATADFAAFWEKLKPYVDSGEISLLIDLNKTPLEKNLVRFYDPDEYLIKVYQA